jgi:Peptidase_C39 like family
VAAGSLAALLAALLPLLAVFATRSDAEDAAFHELWRPSFDGWELDGVEVADGRLGLRETALVTGVGWRGTAVSPVHDSSQSFKELIPSWNAETPEGTWIEVRLRARVAGRWTDWYALGSWSRVDQARRHSIAGQDDADGQVLTDTLALRAPAQAYQVGVELSSAAAGSSPTVSLVAVLASRRGSDVRAHGSGTIVSGTVLDVPERSQMVYPDGGEVWCSPTSTSMVLAYWEQRLGRPELDQVPPVVAAGTYDPVYRGTGNWPFNTAYAGQAGLLGYVTRFSTLDQVERWVEIGVPVVASVAWGPGELDNAPVRSTDGHVLVIVGFSSNGDPVVNDPAGDPRRGQSVQRVYPRVQFESLWLASSGGTVYLIYPSEQPAPADGAAGAW